MNTHPGSVNNLQDKAKRLFTYLKEITQLRFVVVKDLGKYEEVLWLDDIPLEPECECVAWNEGVESSDVWVEVRKAVEPICPSLPPICADWVSRNDLLNSGQPAPKPREQIPAPLKEGEPPFYLQLSDHPEVLSAWQAYVSGKWMPWAKEHTRWKTVHKIYSQLFSIYQQQKKLGETYELRLGLGLLSWQSPEGRIYRHILTGQANIKFDANRGLISVSAAAEGVKLGIEHDMLSPTQLPANEQIERMKAMVEANAESPWNRAQIEQVLRGWVTAMNDRGRYEGGLKKPEDGTAVPTITFAPAIILRRRSAKSLVQLLGAIEKNIEQGGDIPFGIQRLCEIVGDSAPEGIDDDREVAKSGEAHPDDEVYFPLPTNEEQRKIAQRLKNGRGILVQGPPGTGKSHTIANLICHLLATGRRVLVTSQTPRALKVLKEKIPDELSALCVSVLGNDAVALKNMENSVLGITEKQTDWEAGGRERNARRIKGLEEKLFQSRRELAALELSLRQLRERETYKHELCEGAYQGTASDIAQRVAVERDILGWIPDVIESNITCPLSPEELVKYVAIKRSLSEQRIAELQKCWVRAEEILDPEAFVGLVAEETEAIKILKSHGDRSESTSYRSLMRVGKVERSAALGSLKQLVGCVRTLKRKPISWVSDAVDAVIAELDNSWRDLHDATGEVLSGMHDRAHEAHSRRVEIPKSINHGQLLTDARDLLGHLKSGGGLGVLFFRPKVVKQCLYITQKIRVNGRVCANVGVTGELVEHLELVSQIENVWDYWAGVANKIDGPLPRQVNEIQANHNLLGEVLAIAGLLGAAKREFSNLKTNIVPEWHNIEEIDKIIADLETLVARDVVLGVEAKIEALLNKLVIAEVKPNSHQINSDMAFSIKDRNVKRYGELWNELRQLTQDRADYDTQLSILKKTDKVAGKLAALLEATFSDLTWDDKLRNVVEAWNWARASQWIKLYNSNADIQKTDNDVKAKQKSIGLMVADLAAEKAWKHCFAKLNEAHRQHLMAWTTAVNKIGKGTTLRAEVHRRNARAHMDECRGAVPAWIMPFYMLADTTEALPESFDVVIIDEASQSGPEAIALMYLAKQIVVVGDDQQISPTSFVNLTDIDSLSDRLLNDVPHRDTLGVDSSLFNQAVIRFGRRIVLREHFRCVPEIIRFSNDLCYSTTPLMPLRQYPPDRLDPIVVRHVPDGFREGGSGSARNRPEAMALVDAIVECTKNPRYLCDKNEKHPHGKLTFGVISLQGEEQAHLISMLLNERIPPEEIEHRELVCGDAYAFQGDERDVIFLSMVAAPNQKIGALVKLSDKQRFNVAASRARDQVWLYHTATLEDLNPDDMRYKLLSYYLNPGKRADGGPDWDKCESEFERKVGIRIHARNYRLIPQYEPFGPNSYRIDFVVEGLKSRLAVECDGPHHDDPEQIERDAARQRQLERCGWVFWRISASSFHLNPDAALEPLWLRLEEMGIKPVVAGVQEPGQPKEVAEQVAKITQHELEYKLQSDEMPEKKITAVQERLPLSIAWEHVQKESDPKRVKEDENSSAMKRADLLRKANPDGVYTRGEICEMLILFISENKRSNKKEIVVKVARALSMPENHQKRILAAIDHLESAGKLEDDGSSLILK